MAEKKKRPPPPRSDSELIRRLRKQSPEILDAEIDFDALVTRILFSGETRQKTPSKSKQDKESRHQRSRRPQRTGRT